MAGVELFEVGVALAVIAVAGGLAMMVRQSVIPFYIVAGMLAGEHVLGALGYPYVGESDHAFYFIEIAAELGIVLLLFFLGLEFSITKLAKNKDRIMKAGTIDLLNLGVGLVIGFVFFGDLVAAVLVGGIVYISSSAIITKSLMDLGWIANPESEPMLGILVYEDLFIAIYLAVISAVLLGGEGVVDAAGAIGVAVAFILGLLILVYYGTRLFQEMLEVDSNEMTVLRALGVTVLVAGAALALGVSEAVAAFFIGMAFSSTSHVHDIEELLSPVRDVFAAFFFFWIGLVTDPTVFPMVLGLLAVAVVFTAPSKYLTAYKGGRIYGLDQRRSTRVGLGMVTRGEFSLIIAAIAASATGAFATEAVTETIPAFAVAYVLFMSILGTTLMQYSGFFERRLAAGDNAEAE